MFIKKTTSKTKIRPKSWKQLDISFENIKNHLDMNNASQKPMDFQILKYCFPTL